ncbi:MAG: hypothetical protein KatS3mg105_2908 [Gemmatales bacterium]|nr:MAG: hypothetical protein KatS3mg105_2908 [Gemmatales bacterium]
MPAFATEYLGVREDGYSLLLSGTGFGALAAALTVASFVSFARAWRFLALGIVLSGSALILLSLARQPYLAVICCSVIGFGLILFLATGQGVMQLNAGDTSRGRVMALWASTLSGGVPLGNLITGPSADRWSVPAVLFSQGLILLGLSLILVCVFRPWRFAMGRLD